MPELPEVERGRRIAERACVGKTIERVWAADDEIVYAGVTPRRFASALKGRAVTAARRRGKQLWFELDRRPWPLFHYGMTGSFKVYENAKDRPRFCKVELLMEDGLRLAMPNARRLGRLRLQDDPEQEPPISKLGFDPLLDPPTPAGFAAMLARRKTPIKALLLNQSFAAGVGNWIADEVLYQAGVAPQRLASDLSADEARALRTKLRAVVKKACDVDADKERFPRSWLFHDRWGKNHGAVTAAGELIVFDEVGGRTTAWVPSRQR